MHAHVVPSAPGVTGRSSAAVLPANKIAPEESTATAVAAVTSTVLGFGIELKEWEDGGGYTVVKDYVHQARLRHKEASCPSLIRQEMHKPISAKRWW